MFDDVMYEVGDVRYHPATNTWSVFGPEGGSKTLTNFKMRLRVQRAMKPIIGPEVCTKELRQRANAFMRELKEEQRPRGDGGSGALTSFDMPRAEAYGEDIAALIEGAKNGASVDDEHVFVAQTSWRFRRSGGRMFLSTLQHRTLTELAHRTGGEEASK